MASSRFPLLLLLGSVFLAMVSGHDLWWENDDDSHQSKNPYLFRSQNLKTRFQNDRGRIRILPRFDQRHPHLKWLRNCRLSNLELKPHSLFLPHHRDAENIFVVIEGRAIATMVNQTNKETYQLEQGDVMRVPAGNLIYTANVEENQNFIAASLLYPINIPGRYENFYPSGNQSPRSYFHAFSEQTLEATFNSNYKEIRKILFGKNEKEESSDEGVIVKLSKEEAKEIRRNAESSSLSWSPRRRSPSSSSSRQIFNLKNLPPRYSNNHGNLWEARPEHFDLLRDLDMSVAILELQKGSLFLPHYNSKAITIAQIVDGRAKLELASPHLARDRSEEDEDEDDDDENKHDEKEEERREGQIQRVSSTVKQGDVFVALAGHPFALRTPKKNNLWMVAFLLDARNNQRNFLGGERDNVINQIERVVKDQSFEGSGEEVEKLLRNQRESYFVNAEQGSDDDSNVMPTYI